MNARLDDLITVAGEPLTPQERYVLEQAAAGDEADMSGFAGEQRELRAVFLEDLLRGNLAGFKVHQRGVQISNAIIAGKPNLADAEVPYPVSIRYSFFLEDADFQRAHFHQQFFLLGNAFFGKADFQGLHVESDFWCSEVIFARWADFSEAEIGGQFNAEGAAFSSDEHTNFTAMLVGLNALFNGAEFQKTVYFSQAEIGRNFEGKKAKFTSPYGSYFTGLQVGHSVLLEAAEFHGGVDFTEVQVGGQFSMERAKVTGPAKANFNGIKIGGWASLEAAEFEGPVDFCWANIGRSLTAGQAKFRSRELVNFSGLQVGLDASFNQAEFAGPVDCGSVWIGKSLEFRKAIFSSGESSYFGGLKVQGSACFEAAAFQGPGDFFGAEIGRNFLAMEARFNSRKETSCENMRVGLAAVFDAAVFKGDLILAGALLQDLSLKWVNLEGLHLERARIAGELKIHKTKIKELSGCNLQVQRLATLEDVVFEGKIDLRQADLSRVQLLEVKWPEDLQNIKVEGLTYLSLTTEATYPYQEEPASGEKLLAWLQQSRFDLRKYRQVEVYWRSRGQGSRADEVYIQAQRRKLSYRPWYIKWPLHLFWDGLAGYGRKTARIWFVGLILLIIGACLFDPQGLTNASCLTPTSFSSEAGGRSTAAGTGNQQPPGVNPRADSRTATSLAELGRESWYQTLSLRLIISLDRLLPAWVDLGLARDYQLQAQNATARWLLMLYWHLHRLAGWVLVVTGLAAFAWRLKQGEDVGGGKY